MVLVFVRKSECEELNRERNELRKRIKALTNEMETLRKARDRISRWMGIPKSEKRA